MKWDTDNDGVIFKGEFKPPYAPPHPAPLTIEDLEQLQRDLAVIVAWVDTAAQEWETGDVDAAAIERLRQWLPEA